jgi:hypothetical protein
MRGLLQEMIHYRNSLEPEADPDPGKAKEYEIKYQEIMALARKEYEYEPPSQYYKDGYNLYMKFDKYKDNHLLFLYDKRVPTSNNLSERLLRALKRKQKQVMAFRAFDSIDYFCDSMSVIDLLRKQDQCLYASITEIFG